MKFNPFDGAQAGDWALMDGVAASVRHGNARRACFICDLLGGVYISGHASRPRTDEGIIRGLSAAGWWSAPPRPARPVLRQNDVCRTRLILRSIAGTGWLMLTALVVTSRSVALCCGGTPSGRARESGAASTV